MKRTKEQIHSDGIKACSQNNEGKTKAFLPGHFRALIAFFKLFLLLDNQLLHADFTEKLLKPVLKIRRLVKNSMAVFFV